MKTPFKVNETLSITAYRHISERASRRLHIWHDSMNTISVRHQFMQREINLMRTCKRMIKLIQSQLN